jgi:signal transduction histidine kinase
MASYAIARGVLVAENLAEDEIVGLPPVILLCTALFAANYKRLAESWRSNQLALEAAEELRQAETRTVVAESAASMGRLAAAVSHELNSPLGAMRSAADTLPATAKRLAAAAPEKREQLLSLVDTLSDTIVQSSDRMQEIVTRMQRFTNLDGAEVRTVDMNRLLGDVAALVAAETGEQTTIDTSLGQLPNIPCRPQQLSVVFASLLRAAVNRAGAGGRVWVAAGSREPHLEISVNDSAPQLSAAEAARLLDPEFRVSGSRVTTGDWNLFTARRIVREAGGDIRAAKGTSGGNTFVVSLPYPAEAL